MKKFILCLFVLVLCNCEDKKTQPKKTENNQQTQAVKDSIKPKTIKEEPKSEFPVLTDKNAMEFFKQYDKKHKESKVRIVTDFGDIDIQLFNNTKYHRSNFIYLTKREYFNNTQFYRVINNFMIQGGNSDDIKTVRKRREIGRYLLPTDTKKGYKHDRGVISMPSSDIDNPHKLASPFEFFIVQQKGGAYYLDGNYTIFGRVIKGMNVIDKIADQPTDSADWPLQNIYIKRVEILD
ncbi:MAG: peptidylprolyl isomerase [Flavobacteriaceae bacterium]|nr:peptidylprolyl isomerase [Flavobacteriaceae bacterium]